MAGHPSALRALTPFLDRSLGRAPHGSQITSARCWTTTRRCFTTISRCGRCTEVVRMLTPAQLRAARALLDWSQDTLAEKSGTSIEDVRDFESVGSKPKRGMRRRWERALSQGGV